MTIEWRTLSIDITFLGKRYSGSVQVNKIDADASPDQCLQDGAELALQRALVDVTGRIVEQALLKDTQ